MRKAATIVISLFLVIGVAISLGLISDNPPSSSEEIPPREDPSIKTLEFAVLPSQVNFINDDVNLQNAMLKLTYSDGKSKNMALDKSFLKPYDKISVGEKIVNVEYTEKNITLKSNFKTTYYENINHYVDSAVGCKSDIGNNSCQLISIDKNAIFKSNDLKYKYSWISFDFKESADIKMVQFDITDIDFKNDIRIRILNVNDKYENVDDITMIHAETLYDNYLLLQNKNSIRCNFNINTQIISKNIQPSSRLIVLFYNKSEIGKTEINTNQFKIENLKFCRG